MLRVNFANQILIVKNIDTIKKNRAGLCIKQNKNVSYVAKTDGLMLMIMVNAVIVSNC
jgi:hypothetical protein